MKMQCQKYQKIQFCIQLYIDNWEVNPYKLIHIDLKPRILIASFLLAPDVFKMFLFQIQLKYFHDSLNIVVILAPGCESFSTKCVQLPLKFTE